MLRKAFAWSHSLTVLKDVFHPLVCFQVNKELVLYSLLSPLGNAGCWCCSYVCTMIQQCKLEMIVFVLENKECPSGKHSKEGKDQDNLESPNCKSSPPASQNNEQGSTLRDLLTTTAGKLRLGSTDAGIAFAPVYSTGAAVSVYKMHSFSLGI